MENLSCAFQEGWKHRGKWSVEVFTHTSANKNLRNHKSSSRLIYNLLFSSEMAAEQLRTEQSWDTASHTTGGMAGTSIPRATQ